MTRAVLDRTGALQLVRNMIRLRNDLEPLLGKGGTFRLWRLRESRQQRFDRLNNAWGAHCEVLLKRYKWLMNEIHSSLAPRAPASSRDAYFRAWWRKVQNDLPGLTTAGEFSACLWTAVATASGHLEGDAAFLPAAALKPKFMLRQFVDEMTDSEASVSLKILAYSPLTVDAEYPFADAMELSEIVYEACLSLHDAVRRFETSLPAMTAGALDLTGLGDPVTIVRRYSSWLFVS